MTKEKQIEEIKLIIEEAEEEYSEIWNEWFYHYKEGMKIDPEFLFFAKALYNAGYRKASEVAREIFEEIEKIINEPFAVGFELGVPLKKALGDYNNGIRKELLYYVAKLKKKYTEDR